MSYMGYVGKVIAFGALAVSGTLGAVQLASGHDLTGGLLSAASGNTDSVNRSAKADRAVMASNASSPSSAVPMKTVAIRLSQFEDTSFLLRIPATPNGATNVAGETKSAPSLLLKTEDGKREEAKRQVACEPMVSVLTEVAKSLQPGRCVT
jgi:hypothetical protein